MIVTNFNELDRITSYNTLKDSIDKLAKPLIDKKENIGIVVSVYKDKKYATYTYGYKNNFNINPMQKDTIFALGSATKPMIISLMLVLEEKGYLSLDETIGDILPSTINYKDDNVKNITLLELATHLSGLPREPLTLESLSLAVKYQFTGDNIYTYINKDYMYDYLSDITVNKRVDNEAIYSNIGMGLLGHIITLKMNKSLEELLVEYIFEPLNMKNTTFYLNKKQTEMLSEGHVGDFPIFMRKHKPLENWNFSIFMQATGGLYSNAEDLIKYLQANLGESNTRLDDIFKKAHKIMTKDSDLYYTLGWQVQYIPQYDTNIYYKYGVIAGFSCYIGMELNNKIAIVVLKNNFNWEDRIGHQMLLNMTLLDNN